MTEIGAQPAPVVQHNGVDRVDSAVGCQACVFYSRSDVSARIFPRVESLVRSHRRAVDFQFQLWPFEEIESPSSRERIRACADAASVVVIASDDDERMPPALRGWLDQWQMRPDVRKDGLLALFHSRSPDRMPVAPLFRDLIDFAVSSGVGFIWHPLPEVSAPFSATASMTVAG